MDRYWNFRVHVCACATFMHSWEITKSSVLHGSKDRLIGLLSSLNCPVILPCEEEMKKQRWPGGVCLYFRISAVASVPSTLRPHPPSRQRDTEWKSGKDSLLRGVTNTTRTRARAHCWEEEQPFDQKRRSWFIHYIVSSFQSVNSLSLKW